MSLDTIYREGLKKVWELDETSQTKFLDIIGKARGMDASVFRKIGAFFVPNDEYMISYFGADITKEEYGCYTLSGLCNWCNCLVIPIPNVVGKIMGFASFNPFKYVQAHEEHDWSIHYYAYSAKSVFSKGKYLYGVEGTYEKALDDGYLLLVDGVFDAISLYDAGFNAMATMGSTLTFEILMQLRFIKRVILLADNDEAGYKVYEDMQKYLKNVELFKQSKTKDADELLKSENREEFIKQLRWMLEQGARPITLASF